MNIARNDFLLLTTIWLASTIIFYIGNEDISSDFKHKIENSYKTTAVVTDGKHTHSRRSDLYSIEYTFIGFDGNTRAGRSFVDKSIWEQLNSQAADRRTINIYQSRLAPTESYWTGDWERRADKSEFESLSIAGLSALLLMIPIFLTIKLMVYLYSKIKTARGRLSVITKEVVQSASASKKTPRTVEDSLTQLKHLHDNELITTEEFQKKKNDILGRI